MNIEKLYAIFRESAITASLAFLQGDAKTNKAATKRMDDAFKKIEAATDDMQKFYDIMMRDENVYVRLKAITYCGNTKFDIKLALKEIKKLRENKELSELDRMTIDYAIKRWEV